jgi:Raf kinase inhibitor-like YbhB/YbcL family protein
MKAASVVLTVLLVASVAIAGCTAGTDDEDGGAQDDSPASAEEADEASESDMTFVVTSDGFGDDGTIPVEYASDGVEGGQNVSPPISWSGAPEGTNSFALVMVDRHPVANEWIHWMAVDIPADATGLPVGASGEGMPAGSRELENTWRDTGYGGPQPPPGSGEHEYEIVVYALAVESVDVATDASFSDFLDVVADEMVGAASVTGLFAR